MLHSLETTPSEKQGQLYLDKATPYPNLGTLCSKRGTLSRFARTPREGEEGIPEESRDPRALLPVPSLPRKRQRRREKRLSPHNATLRAHLGTPSMGLETPNEERRMPTVKPGSLR
jgi:hypothetical protein